MIQEAFKAGTEPGVAATDPLNADTGPGNNVGQGTGGLY
jgi:hypothetical protein